MEVEATPAKPKVKKKAKKPSRAIAVVRPAQPLTRAEESRQTIHMLARDKHVDVGKYQALLAMHQEQIRDERASRFRLALAKAQARVTPVISDRDNKATSSRYASYRALDRMVRPICQELGLSVSFDSGDAPDPLMQRVLALVSHAVEGDVETGHTQVYHIDVPADGKGPKGGEVMTRTHAVISAVTYGQSKLLKMIFNIPVIDKREDDDGNAASARPTEAKLSDDQAIKLVNLCEETGVSQKSFVDFVANKINVTLNKIADIPASEFDRCVKALNARKQQQGEKG